MPMRDIKKEDKQHFDRGSGAKKCKGERGCKGKEENPTGANQLLRTRALTAWSKQPARKLMQEQKICFWGIPSDPVPHTAS